MSQQSELIYKGAEAELWKVEYLGFTCVKKQRVPKRYRIREIDEAIRSYRIKRECAMIIHARKAINTPYIYDIDLQSCSFLMEFINGAKVRDLFYKGILIKEVSKKIGRAVKAMHDLNIIHGDLTTSNMILRDSDLFFIDFGLAFRSSRIEDKATDIRVFKEMLLSTHHENFDIIWNMFKKSYADEDVLSKLKEIEKRCRYIER